MPLFRALLLWALMLAVPFQGYAAASMAFCGAGMGEAAEAPMAGMAGAAMADGHDDEHDHDHEMHRQAGPIESGEHGHSYHAASDSGSPHACSSCGACHAVAMTASPAPIPLHGLPPADLAEPVIAVSTLAPRVPDRPPRA